MSRLLDVGLRAAALVYLVFQFVIVGVTLLPAVLFVRNFWGGSLPLLAISFGVGYLIFGIAYLVLVIVIKHLLVFRGSEGDHPFVSP